MCAASLGFVLNGLAFSVIQLAGSLTQKVLGTVKNVLLVLWSVVVLHERVSLRQWVGYQVSLLGFVWYQQQKLNAKRREEKPPALAAKEVPASAVQPSAWTALRARSGQLPTPRKASQV